jgi:putative peptidoglycan lipid II flippase
VYRYRPVLDFSDPKLCGLFKLALPAIGTLMLQQIVVFADRAIAVKYGVGSVAALNFASRLVLVLYPLLIGALSSLVLPELSRSIANGEWDHARKLANSICRYAVFLIAPLAAILLMMRGPIIQLAFERGEFTAHDSYLTQGPMACYTLTLLSLSLRELIVRFFYAAHDTITPLLTGTIRTIINLSLNIVLSQWIGISGIALANALAITSDVFILRIIVRRKWGLPSSTAFGLKVAVALIALITVISIFTKTGATLGFGSGWILAACQISISAAIGISVYWGIALLLKVPESKQILSIMRKQFKLTHS